jgi:tetratricopeptide (TPR) repeat protein
MEQREFWQAIQTFNASLEIQRALLGFDNKLILNTLDNLGYAYLCQGSLDAALKTYEEMFYNQESSYSELELDGAATLKKIVYVQLMQTNFEGGLKTLCLLEDIQRDHLRSDSKQLLQTRRLMGQTNYHVMKHPGFGCIACGDGVDDKIDLAKWKPEKPINGSKMSGHRVADVW